MPKQPDTNKPFSRIADAQNIRVGMKEYGKEKSLKAREVLARNLGKILSTRKAKLNLSRLSLTSGISENSDPNRLGRFRILPNQSPKSITIGRLSQDTLAYLRITDAIAKETGEEADSLLFELVIGTKFEKMALREVPIEPFEQLTEILRKKISALDAKYSLSSYFDAIGFHGVAPKWDTGPLCSGRRTSHHAYDRSNLVGWEVMNSNDYPSWTYEPIPSVPLCRLRSSSSGKNKARIKIGDQTQNVIIEEFARLRLGVGPSRRSSFQEDGVKKTARQQEERELIPYLISSSEFRFKPDVKMDFDSGFWDDDFLAQFSTELSEISLSSDPNHSTLSHSDCVDIGSISGSLFEYEVPAFLYDTERNVEIESIDDRTHYFREDHGYSLRDFGCWSPSEFTGIDELDPPTMRGFLGITVAEQDILSLGEDILELDRNQITLAPKYTIASHLETNLLKRYYSDSNDQSSESEGVLDALEKDVERMTSSFGEWIQKSQNMLEKNYEALTNEINAEISSISPKS
jgi:hypothetical protein